ncbi:carbonic anhydrase [Algoriphagus sp.]|uniref:carbonic anhydrase n=1 Tax=Algoriphagus sp. TaxID=1872435 RepID=UPI003272F45A
MISLKNIAYTAIFYFCALSFTASFAQNTPKVNELLKVNPTSYNADRDSAFADPYLGIRKLIYGNKRFAEDKSIRPRQTNDDLRNSSLGQAPFATIVGCSDSRVPNEIIFDQGVGDLFITRTAGQVMAEASYGTIEYGAAVLNTKLIVVLGHESCGAVDAAMKLPENPPGHVVTLINSIKPASLKAKAANLQPKEALDLAIRENVIKQVNELRSLEPVLSRKSDSGEILIVGAVYDLNTGYVNFIEETIVSLPKFSK